MVGQQITVAQCATLSGLSSREILIGVSPTAAHDSLYASYLIRQCEDTRDVIVADIRNSLDLGASSQAADLFIVLRRHLSERYGTIVGSRLYVPVEIERFVGRQNIDRYTQLLRTETDDVKRQMLLKLLAEERNKERAASIGVPLSESPRPA